MNTFLKMGDMMPLFAFLYQPIISDNLEKFKASRIQEI